MDYEYKKLKEKLNTKLGEKLYCSCLAQYNKRFVKKDVLSLPYKYFKDIYKNGDRAKYEYEYFNIRVRLSYLQILAINDDKYLTELEETISAICDEYTWNLPTHILIDKENGKFDYSFIDLFCAETALALSETLFIFQDKLSFDIKERIKFSLKTKIIDNFESRSFWYEKNIGTNWTSVCGGSIGIVYIYSFPERFPLIKDRIFGLCRDYLNGIHSDGVCEEGAGYWNYGFAYLVYFADIFNQKFGEIPDFMFDKKIKLTLEYHKNSIIGNRLIQFADVDPYSVKDYSICELTIKKLFKDYELPKYDFYSCSEFNEYALGSRVIDQIGASVLGARVIDSIGRFETTEKATSRYFSKFYEDSQVFLYDSKNYSFATKGGHNHEMHNHNDIGSFYLIKNDKRIIADFGRGKYTWEYFNSEKERYGDKIFVCGSQSHSVPIIDGEFQKFGWNKKAKCIDYTNNSVKFDIIKAYGIEDATLTVEYVCNENNLKINYYFNGKERNITFRFTSDFMPKLNGGIVEIEKAKIVCNKKCEISVNSKKYERYEKELVGYYVDYSFTKNKELYVSFEIKL